MKCKILAGILIFFLCALTIAKPALAVTFDLIPPAGNLTMGQEITFEIDIDTQGKSLSSTQIGMTYESQYLTFLRTIPGDTFSTITTTEQDGGKLVISGSNPTAFSGSGIFTNVVFQITADAPGDADLCVLWAPETTPVPTVTPAPNEPTSTPVPNATTTPVPSAPTSTPYPHVTAPLPTALPVSGSYKPVNYIGLIGLVLFLPALGIFIVNKIDPASTRNKKHPHKNH